MSFNDKVILVTGGSSGIGAATAIKFTAAGGKVVIVGRNETKLGNVANKCEENGRKPLVIIADMTKDEDVKRILSETINHFGKLDVLVNNAGSGPSATILAENFMQNFDHIMKTNLRSVVYLTHLAAPHLIESQGNVINISSTGGLAVLGTNYASYCTSKAGMDHFSRCVALELAPKRVRVNTVNPGPVKTDIVENAGAPKDSLSVIWENLRDMTALKRLSEPEEVADVIMFLANNKAQSITGSSYVIDNGILLVGGK